MQGFSRKDVFNWLRPKKNLTYIVYRRRISKQVKENKQGGNPNGAMRPSLAAWIAKVVGLLFYLTTHLNMLHNVISDQQGRYIILDISIFQQRCTQVTLYGPNADSPEFFTNLKENLINWKLSNQPIMLCGDWNVVLNYHNDTINYLKENNPNAQKSVLELIDTFELDDVYRDQEPAGRSYTWSAYSNLKQARLDYFLVSTDLAGLVESIQTCAGYRMDHSLVVMNMIFTHQERDRGFWKFNNSLLSDPAYVKLVKDCINETVGEYKINGDIEHPESLTFSINDQLLFETFKLQIRGKTISYAAQCSVNGITFYHLLFALHITVSLSYARVLAS